MRTRTVTAQCSNNEFFKCEKMFENGMRFSLASSWLILEWLNATARTFPKLDIDMRNGRTLDEKVLPKIFWKKIPAINTPDSLISEDGITR